MPLSAIF